MQGQVSVTPVAFGRKSEIFEYGQGKVLKLYQKGFPERKVVLEFENVKKVFSVLRSLVPEPFALIKKHDRVGIVFAKVEGEAYMDMFQKRPLSFLSGIERLADLHRKVFTYAVPGLPTQEDVFTKLILNSPRLTDTQKKRVLTILENPVERKLCHGDFHHGNVIRTVAGSDVIVDWMDAFAGEPALDVALTAVSAVVSDAPPHIPVFYRFLYECVKKVVQLDRRILKRYGEFSESRVSSAVALASAIHLARKEGEYSGHKKYFEEAYKRV